MRQSSAVSTKVYQALAPLPKSKNNEFSILSFNILTKHFENKRYYQYVNPIARKWKEYRYPKIKEIISNYCCDIICLQECDPFTFDMEFGNIYKKDFNYDFIIDTKDTKKQKYINDKKAAQLIIKPATLYKMDKLKLIYNEFRSRGIISLFQLLSIDNTNDNNDDESKSNKQESSLLDSNNDYLFIVNVHLEGEPRKWATRFKQIKSILDRITFRCNELNIIQTNIPIIICGDFNDGMLSSIHKTLIEGGLSKTYYDQRFGEQYKRTEKESKNDYKHNYKFADSYQVIFDNSLQLRPHTFAGNGRRGIVDFIYYTQNNLECFGVSQPLPDFLINCVDSLLLPDENWVSDHLPLSGFYKIISNGNMIDEEKNKKSKMKKEKNKNRKKAKRQQHKKNKKNQSSNNEWIWHEINSF